VSKTCIRDGIDARQTVEFGTSFRISTIYLLVAVMNNGGSRAIGTEGEGSLLYSA
jgi:predicted O-methyltransferase YrrM